MNFREMNQADIEYLKDRSISRGVFKKQPGKIEWSFALEHEGMTLGVGGIDLITLTTAWSWLDLSCDIGEHTIVVYRVIKEYMAIVCKEHGIRRLEAYVEVGFEAGIRLVEHLGYHCEHRMPNFVDDRPADLYVKFYEHEGV